MRLAVLLALVLVLLSGSPASGHKPTGASSNAASPLTLVAVPTPKFPVSGYDTHGAYPQVRGRLLDLTAVNLALRSLVLADQRAYISRARRDRKFVEAGHPPVGDWRGLYEIAYKHAFVSASTVVVSALLSVIRESFRGQPGRSSWMSITLEVESSKPVRIDQLFASPSRGLRVLGNAWRSKLTPEQRQCVDDGAYGSYRPSAHYFRWFALTARGLAIGVSTDSYCSSWEQTVPYRPLRPYLSRLGAHLMAGVRQAQ
jgi:hypothetical protein